MHKLAGAEFRNIICSITAAHCGCREMMRNQVLVGKRDVDSMKLPAARSTSSAGQVRHAIYGQLLQASKLPLLTAAESAWEKPRKCYIRWHISQFGYVVAPANPSPDQNGVILEFTPKAQN